jgi:hypothetical protein
LRTDVAQIIAIEFDSAICTQLSHGKAGFEHNTKRSRRWGRAIFTGVLASNLDVLREKDPLGTREIILLLPLPADLPQGLGGRSLQIGNFQPEIETIIFGGLQQSLGDIGDGYLFAPAIGDNLFRTFKKLPESVRDFGPCKD